MSARCVLGVCRVRELDSHGCSATAQLRRGHAFTLTAELRAGEKLYVHCWRRPRAQVAWSARRCSRASTASTADEALSARAARV